MSDKLHLWVPHIFLIPIGIHAWTNIARTVLCPQLSMPLGENVWWFDLNCMRVGYRQLLKAQGWPLKSGSLVCLSLATALMLWQFGNVADYFKVTTKAANREHAGLIITILAQELCINQTHLHGKFKSSHQMFSARMAEHKTMLSIPIGWHNGSN